MFKNIMYIMIAMLGLSSCILDYLYVFPVINYSDEAQIMYRSTSDKFEDPAVGDTLNSFSAFDKNKIGVLNSRDYLPRKGKGSFAFLGHSKGSIFDGSKDGRVRFYFISDSVFMRNPWATIVKHQMYNRKLTYTYAQMDSLGWIIEYK